MLGRSDGVLYVVYSTLTACLTLYSSNPGGVRFGSAEIYDVIDMCFASSATTSPALTIADCLAVGQMIDQGKDERVILFIKLTEGETLSPDLEKAIKHEIRQRRSARHVPARVRTFAAPKRSSRQLLSAQIIQITDIPYTLNGKRVEVPVKKVRRLWSHDLQIN